MPVNLPVVLPLLPRSTAAEAAASVGQILQALHDSFPAGDQRQLFLSLVSERLYALRRGPTVEPTWVYFSHLIVRECFLDPQGRALRKTAPQEQHCADGSFAPPFVAVDLRTGQPIFVRANARVRRIDEPSDLT